MPSTYQAETDIASEKERLLMDSIPVFCDVCESHISHTSRKVTRFWTTSAMSVGRKGAFLETFRNQVTMFVMITKSNTPQGKQQRGRRWVHCVRAGQECVQAALSKQCSAMFVRDSNIPHTSRKAAKR